MTEPIMLYSAEIDANPFPAYRRLRDAFPCYWSDDAGIWFLSRYADVAKAAVDWAPKIKEQIARLVSAGIPTSQGNQYSFSSLSPIIDQG